MAEILEVKGLKETQRTLYTYSQKLGDYVVIGALKAGANIVKKAAVTNAPRGRTGRLKRGIRVARSKIHRGRKSTDLIGVFLMVARKKKADPFYGRFQEDGWNTRGKLNAERQHSRFHFLTTRRSVGSSRVTQRGKTNVPGKKFIDRAYIAKRAEAVDVITRAALAAADVLARKVGL